MGGQLSTLIKEKFSEDNENDFVILHYIIKHLK